MKNQRVVVAGGTSGIGLAVARKAHISGAHVIIASRTADRQHNDLLKEVGPNIETIAFDITSDADIETLLKQVDSFQHLVIAVRPELENAPFKKLDMNKARQGFDTKFWGSWNLIQKAQKQLSEKGSITLTTGIAGEKIFPGASTMCVINSALETLCRSLAVELAPIRVNAVSPGFVAPKTKETTEYSTHFPTGRLADAAEVAETFLYLMNHAYITGTTVIVDGGARLIG